MPRSCHVLISGDVIGVSFRYYTVEKAHELGLTGWVRNTPEGKVEGVFEGEEEAVQKMLAWIRDGGPRWARVEEVEVRWRDELGGFREFRVVQ